jgi:hypothetical protein
MRDAAYDLIMVQGYSPGRVLGSGDGILDCAGKREPTGRMSMGWVHYSHNSTLACGQDRGVYGADYWLHPHVDARLSSEMLLQEGDDLASAFRGFLMSHVVSEQTPVFRGDDVKGLTPAARIPREKTALGL